MRNDLADQMESYQRIHFYLSLTWKGCPKQQKRLAPGYVHTFKENPYQIQQTIKSFKKEFSKLSNLIFLRFSSPFELVTYHNGVAKASVDPLKNTSDIFGLDNFEVF